jgi:hypothetical protein
MGKLDNYLRTDARDVKVEALSVVNYKIADAAAADADGAMVAAKRVKTTAWVASTARLTNSTSDTLDISAPAMMGATPNAEVKVKLATSLTDVMSVAAGTGDDADTITITLAKTSASNNTAAKIQVAIRALGTVNGIDVSGFNCAGSASWDANTVAKADDTAVALASGATGDYDEIITGLTNPPEPRTITATAAGTAGDVANVAVKVYGTDFDDQEIEEELPYFTANSNTANVVTGSKAFKTITKVDLPAHDGADATTAIGFSDIFGLPFKLNNEMIRVAFDGAWEASAPTINSSATALSSNTIDIVGTPNGEKDVDIIILV